MTKRSGRRYVGTSHMFNVGSDHEFVNAFDLRLDGDRVEAAIGSVMEPDRKQVFSLQGMSGQGIRELLALMEREAYRARRRDQGHPSALRETAMLVLSLSQPAPEPRPGRSRSRPSLRHGDTRQP